MSLDTPNRMAPCFKVVVLEILFDGKKYWGILPFVFYYSLLHRDTFNNIYDSIYTVNASKIVHSTYLLVSSILIKYYFYIDFGHQEEYVKEQRYW